MDQLTLLEQLTQYFGGDIALAESTLVFLGQVKNQNSLRTALLMLTPDPKALDAAIRTIMEEGDEPSKYRLDYDLHTDTGEMVVRFSVGRALAYIVRFKSATDFTVCDSMDQPLDDPELRAELLAEAKLSFYKPLEFSEEGLRDAGLPFGHAYEFDNLSFELDSDARELLDIVEDETIADALVVAALRKVAKDLEAEASA